MVDPAANRSELTTRNRLGPSASLYLRQHADQPVHWQPWDDQAFAIAHARGVPILLSIGYAACHWCHVMARESFDDDATASLMNELFVCIKVDREERPDLDRYYLAALAGLGKASGWPLTAFLAGDATPFAGGGYFPPEPRFGLPGFSAVLREAASLYPPISGETPEVARSPTPPRRAEEGAVPETLLDHIARTLLGGIDDLYGGFGMDGPKFLHAAGHELLLRAWDRSGDRAYLDAVAGSVAMMCNGAVFDHVGGGFHRYCVDDRWHMPHFEKMLNDNAGMIRLCTFLWQATRGTLFAARVAATVEWLLREMRLPCGAFASSVAADSPAGADGELVEGEFYLWSEAALHETLGARHGAFAAAYELTADERLGSRRALTRRPRHGDWSDDGRFDADLAALRIARARSAPPARDDKCLADWNGLAIAAIVEAGMTFGRGDWIEAAEAAFSAVLESVSDGSRLAHCAVGGVRSAAGLLDDYAAMAQASLALYEATAAPRFLEHAIVWTEVLENQFWDAEDGAYYLAAADAEARIPRQKFIDETASPAGNGVMLGVLARLYAGTGGDHFRRRFEGILRCFVGQLPRAQLHAATALCNSQALGRLVQIVIEGDAANAMRRIAAGTFLPDRLILAGKPNAGAGHAHICVGQRCLPLITTPADLSDSLSSISRSRS